MEPNKTPMPERRSPLAALAMGLIMALPALPALAKPAKDVGLITQLTGQVSCTSAGTKKALPASAFMKIRQGDRLELEPAATLKLVFFSSGRQESWTGPAVIQVDAEASRAQGETQPAVKKLPPRASREVRQIPEILQRSLTMTRPGSLTHRGVGSHGPPATAVALSKADQEDIAAAEELYEQMRAELPEDDITPELTLIGLLDVLEQHDRALEVAHQALARQPDNPQLKNLVQVLTRTAGKPPPAAKES